MPSLLKIAKNLIDTWGRTANKEDAPDTTPWPPQSNPDTTTDTLFDASQFPAVVAGLKRRNIFRLFVSAGGIEPDETNGAYFPAQLTYYRDGGNDEILKALAFQFDHGFQSSFAAVGTEIDEACMTFSPAIVEFGWALKDDEPFKGKLFAHAYSRDSSDYIFDYEGVEGIYWTDDFGDNPERMNPTAFLSYCFNPLFGNKYGRNINLPLQPWLQTAKQVFDYWRKALENAGYGNWIATYPKRYAGADQKSVSWRSNLMDELKLLYAGCRTIVEEGVEIAPQKLVFEAAAFLQWWDIFEKTISLIYTGSQTTMVEGKFSSQAEVEGGQARERSYLEQADNIRVCNFWNHFGELFININFSPEQHGGVYPKLSLIPPQLILPTTPKNQEEVDTDSEIIKPVDNIGKDEKELAGRRWKAVDTEKIQAKIIDNFIKAPGTVIFDNTPISELQEEEEEEEKEDEPEPGEPPVAIPAKYKDFPRDTPTPEPYKDVEDAAAAYLADMPAKPYPDVTADEAANVFTIKRLRSFADDAALVTALKDAIIPTLSAENELEAWESYYDQAILIFGGYGLPMDTGIRDDLRISFRQARQNAFSGALLEMARTDDTVTGITIRTLKDGHEIRPEHKIWDGVTLALDDPRLKTVLPPSDFGCVCFSELSRGPLTPESELPETMPGQTYKYYAPKEIENDDGE